MLESQLITPIYSLLPQIRPVYRLKSGDSRIYYTLNENGEPTFFLSLTTMIRATRPTSEYLIKWYADMGYNEAKAYAMERADYGSIMHCLIGRFITDGKYDFLLTPSLARQYAKEGGWLWKDSWEDALNEDMAAFMKFVVDKGVSPLAVELVLVSQRGYGTAIDLVCEMDIEEDGLDHDDPYKSGPRKGQPREIKHTRRINALINFKSKRSGQFYENEEIQLEFEKMLFQENYPEIKIERIFNWAPRDWNESPSYVLKDQTDSINRGMAELILKMAEIELTKRIPDQKVIAGEVVFGQSPVIEFTPATEIIRRRHCPTDVLLADPKLNSQ